MIDAIFMYLEEQEKLVGAKRVRDACRRYMMKRTYAGVMPTKRQSIPRKWITEAYAKQAGLCARCDTYMRLDEVSGDHTIPLVKGGAHRRSNIKAMHKDCNSMKGANDPIQESKETGKSIDQIVGQP